VPKIPSAFNSFGSSKSTGASAWAPDQLAVKNCGIHSSSSNDKMDQILRLNKALYDWFVHVFCPMFGAPPPSMSDDSNSGPTL